MKKQKAQAADGNTKGKPRGKHKENQQGATSVPKPVTVSPRSTSWVPYPYLSDLAVNWVRTNRESAMIHRSRFPKRSVRVSNDSENGATKAAV